MATTEQKHAKALDNLVALEAASAAMKQVDGRTLDADSKDAFREAKANLQQTVIATRKNAKALAKELATP